MASPCRVLAYLSHRLGARAAPVGDDAEVGSEGQQARPSLGCASPRGYRCGLKEGRRVAQMSPQALPAQWQQTCNSFVRSLQQGIQFMSNN
eukprot:scaffold292305_cov23-Prasinocladus_malaysianus.AAC.1